MNDQRELLPQRYDDRDFPVLREIVRLLDQNPLGGIRCTQIEEALPHLSPDDIQRAAVNLSRAGLIDIRGASGQRFLFVTDVSERALVKVGLWPDEDAAGDRLMWILEQKVDEAATPEDRKRWVRIRDSIGSAGRDIAVELAAAMAVRSMGA